MKKYELIIFDFDGTLVDTIADIAHYTNEVLREYGFPAQSLDRIKAAVGWGVHDLLKILEPRLGQDEANLESAVKLFKMKYAENPVLTTEAFAGVRMMLEGPLAGIKKAIVTNKPQDITERILELLGLGRCFGRVIGMNSGFLPKPDPTATLEVIKTLGVTPAESVFIGDSGVDAETSQNAGIDFGFVHYGYHELGDHPARYQFLKATEWEKLLL